MGSHRKHGLVHSLAQGHATSLPSVQDCHRLESRASSPQVLPFHFHNSGDRMIATGIDGRLGGNLDADVSLGFNLHQFIPVNKGAFEQAGPLMGNGVGGRRWMGSVFCHQ